MAHPSGPSHVSDSRTHLVDSWGTLGDLWALLCDPWASLGDSLIPEHPMGRFPGLPWSTGDPGTSLGESWVLGGDPGVQGYLIGIHGWTLVFFIWKRI